MVTCHCLIRILSSIWFVLPLLGATWFSDAHANTFPAEVELSDLFVVNGGDGSLGIVLNGNNPSDLSGAAIGDAGDINNDGINDIVVSAHAADAGDRDRAGQVYILFGSRRSLPNEFEFSSLFAANGGDGSLGFVINGVDSVDRTGLDAGSAGDVNGDGIDDLIIGTYSADPGGLVDAGAGYVVFGRPEGFPAEFELATLRDGDGSAGFVLNGIEAGDFCAIAVSAAGDVNGDGIDDIIVGANQFGREDKSDPDLLRGYSYVVYGRTDGFPSEFEVSSLLETNGGDGTAGFVLRGSDYFALSGSDVGPAGDINHDGIDDLFVAEPGANYGSDTGVGEVAVLFGRDDGFPAQIDVFTLSWLFADGSEGFVLGGIDEYDAAGSSVSGAGDINHDGIDDLIIGALRANPGGRGNAGQSYVVFGSEQPFTAFVRLDSLLAVNGGDGSSGFTINGISAGDESGRSVDGVGDVNGDGIDDVIVGAYGPDPGGRIDAGQSYVIYGRARGFGPSLELADLLLANGADGSTGFVLHGVDPGDHAGASVAGAGDPNGDGINDVMVGALWADPGGRLSAGQSYLVFGRHDQDNDGIVHLQDNCQLQSNPSQVDTDDDGFGNRCDADFDQNCQVNFVDLQVMKANFFSAGDLDTDLDGDGMTDFTDLNMMRGMFFGSPGPSGLPNSCN